ncbi:LCP family protein [Clostridium culturomicium]|uniref:LCP family protein n=1 Tax=Clostridium culturomicium TaxID=1499683 RepID=UPI0006949A1F|nr:LCP family protein [Clostridium culturomicium]
MSKDSPSKTFSKVILSCFIIIITIICISFLTGNSFLSKISRGVLDRTNLGVRDDVSKRLEVDEIADIVNIAILGVDESSEDSGRSDAIMIGTLDPVHNKLKITSIMRDTYVNIPGYGNDKINHAYAYGGAELTIKTLNQNFGLNITDYVKVNFDELVEIVDALNGIDINLSQEELDGLTEHLKSAYSLIGSDPRPVKLNSTGTYHLDGFQALGYCRIRNTSHNDFDRTSRHRKILNEIFNKISSAGPKELVSMSKNLLPYVETSLSNKQILTLAANVLSMSTATIEQERFPRDEYCNDAEINGTYYLWYDADYTEEQMFEYIFNDNKIFLNANQPVYTPQYEYSEDSSNTKTSNPSNNKDNLTSPTINDFNEDLKEVPVITIP